jgi:hypothetical protein
MPRQMDPTELRTILDRLGWSQGYLAEVTGRDLSRTRKMARGREPIDQPLADWLRATDTFFTATEPRRGGDARSEVSAAR